MYRFIAGCLAISAVTLLSGCSPTSMYTHAAKIGASIVGDAIGEDAVKEESPHIMNRTTAELDQRYGSPRNDFMDTGSGREIRVYNVEKDLLGRKRWVVELKGGRAVSLEQAEVNPDLGTDEAKAAAVQTAIGGKTPREVARASIFGKKMFDSHPRNLKTVPEGQLVQIYDVTSFMDISGSRFIVLGYDSAERCDSVRYVGTPKK